ncbi:hypothetical protein CBF23_014515 [Marinomonas agarivorans]|nr:hypothetical protein CBF23_014515 [Marinomonas agarivorans]
MGVLTDICMFFTLVASLQNLPFIPKYRFIRTARTVVSRYALLVVLVALWNILWYAPQHFTDFWGQMAFASGISMLLTLLPIIDCYKLPIQIRTQKAYDFLQQFRWMEYDWKYTMVRLVLFDCIVQYTWTLVALNN